MAESKMAEFKMDAEFKIAAIIKLTENERVKFFLSANGGNQSWQLWVSLRRKTKMAESKLRQNSRWLPSSSWVRMNEWSFFVQMAESKMAEFKIAAIIKLSQNEWVKFFCAIWLIKVESESWQVYGRGKTKMAESNMAEFKMAAIIKLSENEWVWVRLN